MILIRPEFRKSRNMELFFILWNWLFYFPYSTAAFQIPCGSDGVSIDLIIIKLYSHSNSSLFYTKKHLIRVSFAKTSSNLK